MAFTKWQLRKPSPQQEEELKKAFDFPDSVCQILAARGKTKEDLTADFGTRALEDPFMLADMETAVFRIRKALEEEESIVIYGDYDCDGVCATAILYTYLLSVGAHVTGYTPERNKGGYGLNRTVIDDLVAKGTDLLITVDNGISALEEADYLEELGVDLIVTDHHLLSDRLPQAVAVVNPHREDCPSRFKNMCGAGIAFKLVAALEDGDYDTVFDFAGDLAAIATLGDVMPLVGENRLLVQRGLRLLSFTDNLGLRALLSETKLKNPQETGSVLFGLVPRINAAGRLGCANKAFSLLIAEDQEEAQALAKELCQCNEKRQELEQSIRKEALEQLWVSPAQAHAQVLIVGKEGWSSGVIGVTAARLTEQFGKPSIVFSIDGEVATGSARSLGDFSIYEAIASCEDLLLRFGGHKLAAGLTIKTKDLPEFSKRVNAYAASQPPTFYPLFIDRTIKPSEITLERFKEINSLAPFGHGNEQPVFLLQQARLDEIIPLSGGKHLRLKFYIDNQFISAVYFGMEQARFYYRTGQLFHLLVRLECNHYQGKDQVNIHIVELRPAQFLQKQTLIASLAFDALMRGNSLPPKTALASSPTRSEFAVVYRFLQTKKVFYGLAEELYLLLVPNEINYCKLCVILEVMRQGGLLNIDEQTRKMEITEHPPKLQLQETPLLQILQKWAQQQKEKVE